MMKYKRFLLAALVLVGVSSFLLLLRPDRPVPVAVVQDAAQSGSVAATVTVPSDRAIESAQPLTDAPAETGLPAVQADAGSVSVPAESTPGTQGQKTAAAGFSTAHEPGEAPAKRLLTPAEARERIFEHVDNDWLAEGLTPPRQSFRKSLLAEFPEVDLTDAQEFHEMLSVKRDGFGFALTEDTVDTWRSWVADVNALHREMMILRATHHGLSLGGTDERGRGYALIGFEDGRAKYSYTMNVGAAITTGANLVRWSYDFDPALSGTVDGRNLYVNVNDYEQIVEHNEFQLPDSGGSRIMVAEEPWYPASGDHMTHVAGTVAAWGYNDILLGMAPRVWIRALIQQEPEHIPTYAMLYPGELHDEVNPRTGEPQMKSVMGTTSLGAAVNTRYTTFTRNFDISLRDFPYYTHFFAASNDGSAFETLGGHNPLAKNVMTIGAVSSVTRDSSGNYVSGGTIAGFSSRGPAFDGRIKPDFVAKGQNTRSTSGTSGSSNKSGTSMATPNASGSTVLLIDYVHQRFPGHFLRSSTYKALLMNTADDRGNPGPDYTFGWGIINVYAAGKIVRHHAENSYDRVLREERLHPGQTWTYTYESDGVQPIRASLAWVDVAGPSQSQSSTDRTPRLVNDLDMRIIGPDHTVYEPYTMPYVIGQGDTPPFADSLRNAHAVTGDNFTDPAEQIIIASPSAGTYTLQITHKGSLHEGQPQPFSFAVSGLVSATAEPALIDSVMPDVGNETNNFVMAVEGGGYMPGSDVLLRRDGSPVVQAYRVIPVGDRIDFRVDIDGIDKGYYDVVVRAPDGTETIENNGFLMPVDSKLPPVFTSTPVTVTTQNVVYSYSVTTYDEDTPAGSLTLAADGDLPGGLSFTDNENGTGLLSGTPTVNGPFEVALSVTDGDYTTWQIFNLLIFPEGGNTAPVIITDSIPAANEAQTYETLIVAEDDDGHALTFSVGPLPGWLNFTDNGNGTATLSGTPDAGGSFNITVTVTDGFDTDEKTYTLTVNPRPLVGFTITDVDVWEDAGSVMVTVSRTLNDAGAVSVDYATQNGTAQAGPDYTATNGTLSWADRELGNRTITVVVHDDDFTQGDRDFTVQLSNLSPIATMGHSVITVNIRDDDNNTPPQIALHSPDGTRVAVPPGMGLLVSGEVTDDGLPDWGSFTQEWTVAEQPDGTTVSFTDSHDINTGVGFSHEGSYTLVFTADDGEFSDSISLRVEVTETVAVGLPPGNLAVWLPLDESSGATAADESGNSRDATLTGSPTWQPAGGAVGGALQFTASSQRGNIANSAGLNNTNKMSWAFWLKPAGSITGDQGVLGKRTSSSGGDRDWGFWFKANSSNRITFDIGSTRTETSTTIPANEWTHVAFVFDGTLAAADRMRMYVNGDFAQALSVSSATIQNNDVNVALASFQLDDNRNFIGMMDEVVIYHGRALTDDEVLLVMQPGGGNLGPHIAIDPIVGAQSLQPVLLSAIVTDDGMPDDPGTVTVLWSQVAGDGTVTFDDPAKTNATVTFSAPGSYTLRLSTSDGQLTTYAEVTAEVVPSGPFAPVILTQPESLIVQENNPAQFSVTAVGNPEPQYQWFFGGDQISDANSNIYAIAAVTPAHEGNYFVRVWNAEGTNDSDTVTLSILNPPETYTVTYAANSGSGDVPTDGNSPYEVGQQVTVLGAGTLAKAGHAFNGWRDNVAAVTYDADDTFLMPARNIELVAQWTVVGAVLFEETFDSRDLGQVSGQGGWGVSDPAKAADWNVVEGGLDGAGNYIPGGTQSLKISESTGNQEFLLHHSIGNQTNNLYARVNFQCEGSSGSTFLAFGLTGDVSNDFNNSLMGIYVGNAVRARAIDNSTLTQQEVAHGTNANSVFTFVIKAEKTNPAGNYDKVTLFLNPELSVGSSEPGSGIATATRDIAKDTLTHFFLRGGGTGRNYTIDSIAVGASWEEMTGVVAADGYSVTYDASGGTGDVPVDGNSYATGTVVTVMGPGSLAKDGYIFTGWSNNATATTYQPLDTFAMPETNVTLTAQWESDIDGNIVIYAGNGNTDGVVPVDANSPYTNNATVTVLGAGALTRTGHSFNNWNTAADGSGDSYAPDATFTITNNVTLYAQWTVNQYTITFDSAGGSAVAPITQDYGTAITAPTDPTQSGYSFAGWNPEIPATMPASNLTVTAQWTALSSDAGLTSVLSLTDSNPAGGDGSDLSDPVTWALDVAHTVSSVGIGDVSVAAGASLKLYSDADFSANEDQPIALIAETAVTAYIKVTAEDGTTVRYYAVTITRAAEPVVYNVTYNANGGSGDVPVDSTDYEAGAAVTVLGAGTLTKAGHTFNGWRDNVAAVTYDPEDTFPMPARDVTLVAQWTVLGGEGEYLEPFDNTTDKNEIANVLSNWYWAVHDGLSTDTSGRQFGRLSNANGFGGSQGLAYQYHSLSAGAASVFWYDGQSFDPATLTTMSAYVGHSDNAAQMRFLIRIGEKWYISVAAGAKNVGSVANFESGAELFEISFSPAGSNWVELNYDGLVGANSAGFSMYSGDISGSALTDPLPAGSITAIGGYLYGPNGKSTRFDHLKVTWGAPGEGYTVTYAANGGTGDVPLDGNSYATGTVVTVMAPGSLAKDGYTFAGWHDGTTLLQPLDTFAMPETNVTLTAQWAGEGGSYSISGKVSGAVAAGVTIGLSGVTTDSTATGSDGTYSFSGLSDGTYTLTPSLAGYSFDPASREVTLSGADSNDVDFVAVQDAPATVLYVNHAASGANNGIFWADAFTSLRGALAAAQAGQEIWVAAGSYNPYVDDRTTDTFLLPSEVALYGGFAGNESERSERDWETNETILSGFRDGENNLRHIVTATGAVDARIDGFTIRDGHADGSNPYGDGVGAAVFVGMGEGRLTLANCRIVDHVCVEGGAAFFAANTNNPALRIENTVFADNAIGAEWARGVLQLRSSAAEVWIEDSRFENNPSGIFSEAGTLRVLRSQFVNQTNIAVDINYHGAQNDFVNCVFDQNGGGAIRMTNSDQLRVANCVFARNTNPMEDGSGGALNISQGRFEVYNSTFYGNSADEGAAIAWSYGWAGNVTSLVHNSIFWGNSGDNVILLERYNTDDDMTLELRNNLLQGGAGSVETLDDPVLVVENLIDGDPLFVNESDLPGADGLWGTEDDGLRLQAASPAVNAALAGLLPADWLDINGNEDIEESLPLDILGGPRVQGDHPALGAYEQPAAWLPPPDTNNRYWGGETANWTGTASWFDNPELNGTGVVWQDGWHAVIIEGDPALNASVTTSNLHIHVGARTRIGGGNQILTVTGDATGTGSVRFDRTAGGNTSGLRFESETAQTVAWDFLLNQNESRVRLVIAGSAPVTLDGIMQAWGNDFDIFQESGSHVIIGPNARINNNRPDLINARPFQVWPADATAVFEMHADFDVDLADPDVLEDTYPFAKPEDDPGDGSYVKPVGGLSTWRTVSGTTITHTTHNLASIHKYTGGDKRYTHHGLWNFEGTGSEPDPVWIVRTNPQSYDGGIYFVRDWTLNTEEDFTFEGLWHDGVNIGFSTRSGAQNITFTKTGPADFIIKGTQAYGPGSVMRVEEGGVRFHTDPLIGAVPKAGNSWFNGTGNYLELEVHAGAEASFLPPENETFHLASADIAGRLILEYAGDPVLVVSNDFVVSGTLEIVSMVELGTEAHVIATVGGTVSFDGASFVLPEGWQVVQQGTELLLQPVSEDPFDDWWTDYSNYFDPGASATTVVTRAGYQMTIHDIFIAGLNPSDPNDVLQIVDMAPGEGADGKMQFKFNMATNRTYDVLWTSNLFVEAEDWLILTNIADSADGGVLTVTDAEPDDAQRFYRIRVKLLE